MKTLLKSLLIGLIVVGVVVLVGGYMLKGSKKNSYVSNNDPVVTTEKKTTEQKTTEKKTTEKKTTEKRTTEKTTSSTERTTERVTTQTTIQQTTTQTPSTQAPSTQAPTTQQPSTRQPSTQTPTTQQPTTQRPTTEQATTQAPTTQHQHDWQPIVESVGHSFCRTCNMDLSAAGISVDAHDEASGMYTVNVGGELYEFYNCAGSYTCFVDEIVGYRCSTCGATK